MASTRVIEEILRLALDKQRESMANQQKALEEGFKLAQEHMEKPWKSAVDKIRETVKILRGESENETDENNKQKSVDNSSAAADSDLQPGSGP